MRALRIGLVVVAASLSLQIVVEAKPPNRSAEKSWKAGEKPGDLVYTDGNVGIGTTDPESKLHIVGGDVYLDGGGYNFVRQGAIDVLASFRGGTVDNGIFIVKRFGLDHTIFQINSPPVSLGALEATLSLVRGDEPDLELVDFYNNGYASETQFGIRIIKRGKGEFRDFVFDYFDGINPKFEVMRLKPSGNVGIGTPIPTERLDVAGNVRADSFIAGTTTLVVPDHVFERDYDLMPLDDLRQYITRQKHLPNVPSAAEIKKEGLNLSEFQMKLLEKIEELTLHTLAQQDMLQAQQTKIESLAARLDELTQSR